MQTTSRAVVLLTAAALAAAVFAAVPASAAEADPDSLTAAAAPDSAAAAAAAVDTVTTAAVDTAAAEAGKAPRLVDRILVIVDEEPILQSDVDHEMALSRLDAANRGGQVPADDDSLRSEVIERLIESKLLVAAARQEKIEISDESVDKEVQANVDQLVRYYGSEARLDQELARNGMTLEDYRRRSASQLRDQQYMRAVINRFIRPKIEVRDDEIEDYYKQHIAEVPASPDSLVLSDILIPLQPSAAVQRDLQAKLGTVMKELGDGQPFADVARRHSEGPAASRGGRLGRIKRGDLFSRALEDAVFQLHVGETSPPVVSERGLHILHLDAVDGDAREVSQIFFPIEITEADVARAKAEADSARARVEAGEPFAVVAGEMSQDTNSADRGGELGTFALSDLSPAIQEHLRNLKAGELSEVFQTPAGFYVFLVRDRIDGHRLTLAEVRPQVRQAIESQKMEKALKEYVAGLRDRFVVDRKD